MKKENRAQKGKPVTHEAIFYMLKFKLGSEACGNKTKEITSRLRGKQLIFFILFPLTSEPCWNFNLLKMAYFLGPHLTLEHEFYAAFLSNCGNPAKPHY